MKRFSQRKGFKPVPIAIQTNGMNDDLRNTLWNALDTVIWRTNNFLHTQIGKPGIDSFSNALWFHFFKKPIDVISLIAILEDKG